MDARYTEQVLKEQEGMEALSREYRSPLGRLVDWLGGAGISTVGAGAAMGGQVGGGSGIEGVNSVDAAEVQKALAGLGGRGDNGEGRGPVRDLSNLSPDEAAEIFLEYAQDINGGRIDLSPVLHLGNTEAAQLAYDHDMPEDFVQETLEGQGSGFLSPKDIPVVKAQAISDRWADQKNGGIIAAIDKMDAAVHEWWHLVNGPDEDGAYNLGKQALEEMVNDGYSVAQPVLDRLNRVHP